MNVNYIEEPNRVYCETDQEKFVGECTYSNAGKDLMIIDHTLVETPYRGYGIAAELVGKVVDVAREKNKKIIPLCPYAKAEFDRKPEYHDVCRDNK
ncbi:GNAT family N-acetyltransferase [Mycoplasma sp. P36-A1]|uniref:GNAT family N-acetyltransferase n=1 Tax=Mycoplasma sp. P36-A1 TaxID=3252900 RepID=UPI003C2D5E36